MRSRMSCEFRRKPRGVNKARMCLLVVRTKSDGSLADSTPCVVCQRFIEANGIRHVWHSNKEGEIVKFEKK